MFSIANLSGLSPKINAHNSEIFSDSLTAPGDVTCQDPDDLEVISLIQKL